MAKKPEKRHLKDPDPTLRGTTEQTKFPVGSWVQGNLLRKSIEEGGGYSQGNCVCKVEQAIWNPSVKEYYYELRDCRWLDWDEDGWDSTRSFAPEEFLTLYEGSVVE